MDLIERIDRWGLLAPDRPAHLSGGRSLSYGELMRRSDAFAAYLAEARPSRDDRTPVAVRGHKEPEMLVAFLGAAKGGHPYVPIDAAIPPQRVDRIVAASGAGRVLTPETIAAVTDRPATPAGLARHAGPDDAFYILFTSGSTGEPKGVIVTWRGLTSFVDWMLSEHAFAERGETFLNQAPFSFDLSVMDLYCSLATGGSLFSITRDEIANPAQLYRSLAQSNVTVWVSTPSFAQVCLVERTFAAAMLPRLRTFLFCGETLAPDVAMELSKRFPDAQVWNTYGPTEATVATTSVLVTRDVLAKYSPLPVGYPKHDGRIVVQGEDGRALAEGERGEIVIAGPHVSPGYVGRPDLTAKAFFDLDGMRAYRTGDWGHFRDGLLFFEGRRDRQIKLHGHRIELGDVEAHLQALPGVRDGVILVETKSGQPDALAAFVILDPRPTGSAFEVGRALRRALAERLPPYMLPRKFQALESFPMTANGKVDRNALAELVK